MAVEMRFNCSLTEGSLVYFYTVSHILELYDRSQQLELRIADGQLFRWTCGVALHSVMDCLMSHIQSDRHGFIHFRFVWSDRVDVVIIIPSKIEVTPAVLLQFFYVATGILCNTDSDTAVVLRYDSERELRLLDDEPVQVDALVPETISRYSSNSFAAVTHVLKADIRRYKCKILLVCNLTCENVYHLQYRQTYP